MLKRQRYKGDDGQVHVAQRNDQCPCGKKKIVTYRAGDGSIIKEQEERNKFKNCCMVRVGYQAGTAKGTEELLKERRSHVGWPMRDYVNTPVSLRKNTYQRGGYAPRATDSNNNRRWTSGRKVWHKPTEFLVGTSIMISPRPKDIGKIPYEQIQIGKANQVSNRLAFIPFEYKKGKKTLGEQVGEHRLQCFRVTEEYYQKHGWNVSPLEKWESSTKRINLTK